MCKRRQRRVVPVAERDRAFKKKGGRRSPVVLHSYLTIISPGINRTPSSTVDNRYWTSTNVR
jgi:hypothetical protein